MKKIYLLLCIAFISCSVFAQAPQSMSYQAIIRNNDALLINTRVGIKITILKGSPIDNFIAYSETQNATTNQNGLLSLLIGGGTTTGVFSAIDWSTGTYFIKTETDPTGGSNYTITGTSQMMSVPYALYARTSGSCPVPVPGLGMVLTDNRQTNYIDFASAAGFGVYTSAGAIANTGTTTITGNVGSNAGAISGFGTPSLVVGSIMIGDAGTKSAATDLAAAYTQLKMRVPSAATPVHGAIFGNGETLYPGVYEVAAALSVSGQLILDGQNKPDAQFIIRTGGAFTTTPGAIVALTNGANAENVFWVAEGAVAIGASTTMTGVVVANNAAISVAAGGSLNGRLYTTAGAIAISNTNAVGLKYIVPIRIMPNADIVIKRNVTIGSNLNVDSTVTLNTVSGSTINYGAFTVERNSTSLLTGQLFVNGTTRLKNTLLTDGATTLDNTLDVTGATHLKSTLLTEAATTLHNTLDVAGATHLYSTLLTENATILNNKLDVLGATHLSNTLLTDAATTLGSTLDVTGASNLKNVLNVTGATYLKSTLITDAATNLNNTLDVTGATKLNNTLDVAGGTNLNNTLDVTGATNLKSTLTTDAATKLNNTLDVTGATKLNSTLDVTGATHLRSTLITDKSLTVHNKLVVKSNTSYIAEFTNSTDANGILIKIGTSKAANKNKFVTFQDADGTTVGSIQGEKVSEFENDAQYNYDVSNLSLQLVLATATTVMAGFDVAAAAASSTPCVGLGACVTVPIISEIVKSVANFVIATANLALQAAALGTYVQFKTDNVGVTYSSGAGDYAEWLPKANQQDIFHYGDIVGVKGGLISKVTFGAEKFMVISQRPIVLGNTPKVGMEGSFEKVAFMGQVPVKVNGDVSLGDYIVISNLNNGFGKAVHPNDMTASDYQRIVGIAWTAVSTGGVNYVKVAVGINTNDIARLVEKQENEITILKNQIATFNEKLDYLTKVVSGAPVEPISYKKEIIAKTINTEIAIKQPSAQSSNGAITYRTLPREIILAGMEMAERNFTNTRKFGTNENIFFNKIKTDKNFKEEFINNTITNFNKLIAANKITDKQ